MGGLAVYRSTIHRQPNKNIFIRIPAERAFLDPGDTPQFAGGGAELIKGTRQKIYDHP